MPLQLPRPPRCSLIQAALWVCRLQEPIPDEIFDAAPLELELFEVAADGPLRPLLQALRGGLIRAWGRCVLEVAPQPGEWSEWRPLGSARNILIPEQFWVWSDVDWVQSTIARDLGFSDFVERETFTPELQNLFAKADEVRGAQRVSISWVQVDAEALAAIFFAQGSAPDAGYTGSTGSLRGRKEKFEWRFFYAELVARLHEKGLPKTQNELVEEMALWCQETWGERNVPGTTTLKDAISPLFKRLRGVSGADA